MTYTVGDKRISLDRGELDDEEKRLILAHLRLFKCCINNASYKYLLNLKKVIHLYGDIITIYSMLLRKVPGYDDITLMSNRTKLQLIKLEDDFNRVFGMYKMGGKNRRGWEDYSYEKRVRPLSLLYVETTDEVFQAIMKDLNCIEVFFNSFDNLKKLLIPHLLSQTKTLHQLIRKSVFLFRLVTIADEITHIKQATPAVLKQLRKVEKITGSVERELVILESFFITFDPSLQQYTSILLGKAILKRDVNISDCQIIKRRSICFQAAEHVVSIPLTEDNYKSSSISRRIAVKYLAYICLVLALVVTLVIYRLLRVVFT